MQSITYSPSSGIGKSSEIDHTRNHEPLMTDLRQSAGTRISSLSFLDLPAEVRNMTYAFYFRDTYVLVEMPDAAILDSPWKIDYRGRPVPRSNVIRRGFDQGLWVLFTLSKKIAIEAHSILFSTAVFVFRGRRPFLDVFHSLRLPGVPQSLLDHSCVKFNPFDHIQHFHLDLTTHLPRYVQEIEPEVHRNTISILRIIHAHLPQLKCLFVTFDDTSKLFTGRNNTDLQLHPWLLKSLCGFNHLDEFGIRYETFSDDRYQRGKNRFDVVEALNQILRKHVQMRYGGKDVSTYRFVDDQLSSSFIRNQIKKKMRKIIKSKGNETLWNIVSLWA